MSFRSTEYVEKTCLEDEKSQKGVVQACVRTTPLQTQDVGVRSEYTYLGWCAYIAVEGRKCFI